MNLRDALRPGGACSGAAAHARISCAAPRVRSFGAALVPALFLAVAIAFPPAVSPLAAQAFTIEEVLAPAFPYSLAAARDADRIAWIEYEAGVRNVYTAAAPDFTPVRLTDHTEDDGVDLSGIQLSDDGSIVLFIRGHAPNREGWVANPASDADGAERAAWAVRTSGGPAWRIAEARDPVLSPDGRWIAYTRDGQIHRAPVDPERGPRAPRHAPVASGHAPVGPGASTAHDPDEAGPAFTAFGTNGSPVWSPDSRRIAFVSRRGDHAFVGVYDTAEHTVRYMAPSVDHDGAPTWSPDGTRIAFIRRPGTPFNPEPQLPWWRRSIEPDTALPDGMTRAGFQGGHTLEIWIADARTGQGERLWHSWPQDERFTDITALDWVGDHIVFRSEPGEWEGHRFAISVDSPAREPIHLTSRPGFVEEVAYSPDGRWLFFSANTGDVDRRHLWRVPVAGGEPEQVTRGTMIETFPAVLGSGERVALLRAGAREPQHVAVVAAAGGDPRAITRAPQTFPRHAHVEPENVVITAEDGLSFHSQLFLPPDLRPGEERPALIFIHGGPRRQMLLGYNYGHFYHMAYAMNQYFASQGYVVLSINFRSGIGYGTAFRDIPDYGRRGSSEYRDVLAAGRYLQSRPDVDAERVGLWGLSYGGILTALGLARNSDIFKAGVDIAGVHLYGDADDPESTLYRASAVADIDSWTSPVLLIHGDDDRNVSFSQTVGLVQLLRAREIPFELIVYPDEVHVFLVHQRWIEAFHATDDFLDRHIRRRGETVD